VPPSHHPTIDINGWNSAGDIVDFLWALGVISTCNKIDGHLPRSTIALMVFRAVLDWIIGLIPILGDAFDAVYKCNTANVDTLEKFLEKRGQKILAMQGKAPAVASLGGSEEGPETEQYVDVPVPYGGDSTDPTSVRQRGSAKASKENGENRGGWFRRSGRIELEEGHKSKRPADVQRRRRSRSRF
jgi:hypothetical protein